ncbi:hypothetical protein MKX01_029856 [Papaver californicum]|nr:hypothetical protein MKX01_029856 [Papaver californicum]
MLIEGEMFTFGCQLTPPYCPYRVISKDGFMHDPVPITLSVPTIMHDFAITQNFAIFMDLPLKFRPKNLVTGEPILAFDATKKARFGVLPRYSTNEHDMRWFDFLTALYFTTIILNIYWKEIWTTTNPYKRCFQA